jgi:hypothetical protein
MRRQKKNNVQNYCIDDCITRYRPNQQNYRLSSVSRKKKFESVAVSPDVTELYVPGPVLVSSDLQVTQRMAILTMECAHNNI